jgi:hypothetical protein
MAAIVGGIAFAVLTGCGTLAFCDAGVLESPRSWAVFTLSLAVASASVLGYFHPYNRAVYVAVILGGSASLGCCFYITWWLWQPDSRERLGTALVAPAVCFGTWFGWAAGAIHLLGRGPAAAGEPANALGESASR